MNGWAWQTRVLVSDLLVWAQSLIYWDSQAQPSLWFTENDLKKARYPLSGKSLGLNAFLGPEVRGELDRLIPEDREAAVPQITTCYNWGMQRTIFEWPTCWTLKQQRTTLGVIPVSCEWKTVATISTSSPKLDNRRLENHWLVCWVSAVAFSCSEFWCKQHEHVDSSCQYVWFRLV